MTPAQLERWHRIEQLALSPPDSVVSFSDKLMQATGWTHGQCDRAIAEYRRFLLLAAEAGHPVSPSPDVDEVWHLHLLYTRGYWDDLCPNVLGFRLHHEPATGTTNDRAKLDDWYARTLASYQTIFGEPAPSDVWPEKPRHVFMQRVDPTHSVVLPRLGWYTFLVIVVFLMGMIVLLLWNQPPEGGEKFPAIHGIGQLHSDPNSQPEVIHVRDYEPV